MVIQDWTECPECHFPALYSAFKDYISVQSECPMCHHHIKQVHLMTNVDQILKSKSDSIDKESSHQELDQDKSMKRANQSIQSPQSPEMNKLNSLETLEKDSIVTPGLLMNEFNGIGGMAI